MDFGPDIIEQNTKHVEPATAEMSEAQIDDVARRASAEVKSVEGQEAGMGDNHSGVGLLIEGVIESIVPGAKFASGALEVMSERGMTGQQNGAAPVSIDDHIKDSFKTSGESLISSVMNVKDSLFGKSATDEFRTDDLVGGSGKKNGMNIPTDQSAANQLSRSIQKVAALKNHHQHALDSVPRAQAELGAIKARAMQMAPGMDLSGGPRFNANQIMQEADRYRQQSETGQA